MFDYFDKAVLEGRKFVPGAKEVMDWAREAGEPFRFGLEADCIEGFLNARNVKLIRNYSPSVLEQELLQTSQGDIFGRTTGFYSIVYAVTRG